MKRMAMLVALLPGFALAQQARKAQETSQRGSGAQAQDTATPGPGLESGRGNALGRTDLGPTGETGMTGATGPAHERALAKANDQARGANEKGSFLRPADTPPQIELDPHVMGSGAEEGTFPLGGHNYFDEHSAHGKASGIASGSGNPGGSAGQGSSGKSERTQER
jgi:hypothetical protein